MLYVLVLSLGRDAIRRCRRRVGLSGVVGFLFLSFSLVSDRLVSENGNTSIAGSENGKDEDSRFLDV